MNAGPVALSGALVNSKTRWSTFEIPVSLCNCEELIPTGKLFWVINS